MLIAFAVPANATQWQMQGGCPNPTSPFFLKTIVGLENHIFLKPF
jgi:hypothetical protein